MTTAKHLHLLFDEPIMEITELDPGYSDHASDVWLVKTVTHERVVRASRWHHEPDHEFWLGCRELFGIDPRFMIYFHRNTQILNTIPDIPAPHVFDIRELDGRETIIVESMQGEVLRDFIHQPESLLYSFGVWLAKVHLIQYDWYGNAAETKCEAKGRFHQDLARTMRLLVNKDYQANDAISDRLDEMVAKVAALPIPEHFCPILVDLDPSQFLQHHGQIRAIVDTEAYVIAPREFDFISLEYVLDLESSRHVIAGYTSLLEMPDLSLYREVYRYFYRLLGVQGQVELEQWMAQPELF
ncbi:hypothetical protein JCM10914A_02270 [Paenibacillus sp. JCM 10914]